MYAPSEQNLRDFCHVTCSLEYFPSKRHDEWFWFQIGNTYKRKMISGFGRVVRMTVCYIYVWSLTSTCAIHDVQIAETLDDCLLSMYT